MINKIAKSVLTKLVKVRVDHRQASLWVQRINEFVDLCENPAIAASILVSFVSEIVLKDDL